MTRKLQWALNQATAPGLSFEAFLDLASCLGCVGVEPRNDMKRPLFDGLSPEQATELARSKGLKFVGLSQVYPFNDWSVERGQEIADLAELARACSAPGISLIPRVDGRGSADGERQTILRDVLASILPVLRQTGVMGLVEPIGFPFSSLRIKSEVADVIENLDAADCLGIVHDTFQHTLAGDAAFFPDLTAIVHVSGVSDPKPAITEKLDAERVLIDRSDRIGNIAQMQTLLDGGYTGVFSFECTSPSVHHADDLQGSIDASMTFVESVLSV
jgi:2-keto-myo-inositol isomerase